MGIGGQQRVHAKYSLSLIPDGRQIDTDIIFRFAVSPLAHIAVHVYNLAVEINYSRSGVRRQFWQG
jgi:hypothetical protein